jgi:hypothetical protein
VNYDALCNGGNGLVDRISGLPDELLCHILTFLPIKQAFITTLLSKRWTPLCYSLPSFRFNFDYVKPNAYTFPVLSSDDQTKKDDGEDEFYRFCRFVNTLMLSPISINQQLQKFHLRYFFPFRKRLGNHKGGCQVEVFKECLESVKRRGVEDLYLSLSYHALNPTIFISRTLVVLRLVMLYIASDTSCVDLPLLKTLDLRNVYFKNRNDYINFLSACPILQDLHVERIYIQSKMHRDENNAQDEGSRSLTLSKLVRASFRSMDPLFNGIDNVEFLRITTGFTEASFKVIKMFTKLIHIELRFFYNNCWDGVVELLRHCPKLQILSIEKVC